MAWADGLAITAHDPELPRAARALFTLDHDGLAYLRRNLEGARDREAPIGLLVLDSLSRLKPPECDENSNADMSAWLEALETLARDFACYVLLIHHVGHAGRAEAVAKARGASAIAAVPQALWALSRELDNPRVRSLAVEGNALEPMTYTFRVAAEEANEGAVLYWQLVDAWESHGEPTAHLVPGVPMSLRELARAISGEDTPGGQARERAKAAALAWRRAGLVEMFDGPRRSVMVRLLEPGEPADHDAGDDLPF